MLQKIRDAPGRANRQLRPLRYFSCRWIKRAYAFTTKQSFNAPAQHILPGCFITRFFCTGFYSADYSNYKINEFARLSNQYSLNEALCTRRFSNEGLTSLFTIISPLNQGGAPRKPTAESCQHDIVALV